MQMEAIGSTGNLFSFVCDQEPMRDPSCIGIITFNSIWTQLKITSGLVHNMLHADVWPISVKGNFWSQKLKKNLWHIWFYRKQKFDSWHIYAWKLWLCHLFKAPQVKAKHHKEVIMILSASNNNLKNKTYLQIILTS